MDESKTFYIELKELRESKDYSLDEISDFTKIDIKYLIAIEEGEFSSLSNVYMRLFLRSYCQYIKADAEKTLNDYQFYTLGEKPTENLIRELYSDFKQLRKFASLSKDYFYEALDLEEEENLDTKNAISEMKSAINQMDNIFIPSIRTTARDANVELE